MFNKQKIVHLTIGFILITSFTGVQVAVSAYNGNAIELNEAQIEDPMLEEAKHYAELHGVTVDEALLRLELQDVTGDLDAELTENEADTFAGLWIEHTPEFKVIVLFTQKGNDTIEKYLPEELDGITDVRTAEKTLVELQDIQSDASSSLRGLDIAADLYIDIYENCVKVNIADADNAKYNDCLAEGKLIVSKDVVIEFVDELATPDTTIYGGLTLFCPSTGTQVTSGFSVEDASGNKGVTTAGHCNNWQWWGIHYLVFEEEKYEGSCDVQWHSTNLDVDNLIRDWDDGSTREIRASKSRTQQSVGGYVAKYGRVTGWTAGYIESKTYQPSYVPDVEPTFILVDNYFGYEDGLSEPGDSGCPWFNSYYAYGCHSGSANDDAIYMAINYLSEIDVSLLTD